MFGCGLCPVCEFCACVCLDVLGCARVCLSVLVCVLVRLCVFVRVHPHPQSPITQRVALSVVVVVVVVAAVAAVIITVVVRSLKMCVAVPVQMRVAPKSFLQRQFAHWFWSLLNCFVIKR